MGIRGEDGTDTRELREWPNIHSHIFYTLLIFYSKNTQYLFQYYSNKIVLLLIKTFFSALIKYFYSNLMIVVKSHVIL